MKKVLHLFPAYKIGGAPVNVLRFIKGSKDKIRNYAAACNIDGNLFNKYVEATDDSFDVNLTSIKLSSYLKLLRIVKIVKPDIIHANGKGGAFYAFLIYIFYKVDIYYTFRGFHIKYSGIRHTFHMLFEKLFSYCYVKAIAVSHSEKELYLKTTGVNDIKVTVIGNGVDISKMQLPSELQGVLDKYKINIVSLSRIDPVKDIVTMLKSFALLNNQDTALHIMGGFLDGDILYKEKVESTIKSLKCSDRVYLWGDMPSAGNYIHNFDLYLSTSLSEGLPTSIIEAGLSKIPVIASNCNGNIDLIKDFETGYLFSKKDIEGLVSKLQLAIDQLGSVEQSEILIKNLNQMHSYSIDSHVNKLIELYINKGIEGFTSK